MKFLKYVFIVLVTCFAGLAFGADKLVSPSGSLNAWDLHVFGNGEAIAHILTSIKLLIAPDAGSSGFRTLLMFLATLGFIVLAIQAGFNPGQHLLKMFAFLLVTWMVVFTSTSMRANITVNDPVTGYHNTVPGVPALVGVPAAVVSEVGYWFTMQIEQNFSMPGGANDLLMTTGGVYNLFGKMMSDADKYVITNPNLKRNVSSYVADCVVPAIARGALSVTDLTSSAKMMDTLAKAKHNSILTKYYSPTGDTANAPTCAPDATFEGEMGALLSCADAYSCMSADMETHADDLFNGAASKWASTGTLVPFETAMNAALGAVSSGSATSGYGRPQGMILQKAMVSQMSGSFRQAAVQTGNNELLMAASVAQAEQQQKTSWWVASELFKNMMGYVYTVLQAFIFAIVPLVIMMLMIPGLGKSIFVNYGQILIWLTLWMPLLALINYLIVLFGHQDLTNTWSLAGGVTMQNTYELSEQSNNLVIAAQFLGTMVPLITWGLVKGAMAFTEFISHGIGTSFASGAATAASTGNMSMNNMSMDNTSMNKFNTAYSSSVGFQDTNVFTNAGSVTATSSFGGTAMTANGGTISATGSHQEAVGHQLASSDGITNATSAGWNMGAGNQKSLGDSHGHQTGSSLATSRGDNLSHNTHGGIKQDSGYEYQNGRNTDGRTQISQAEGNNSAVGAGGKLGVRGAKDGGAPAGGAAVVPGGPGGPGGGGAPGTGGAPTAAQAAAPAGGRGGKPSLNTDGGFSGDVKATSATQLTGSRGVGHNASYGNKAGGGMSYGDDFSHNRSSGKTASQTDGYSHGKSGSNSQSSSFQAQMSNLITALQQFTESMSHSTTTSMTYNAPRALDNIDAVYAKTEVPTGEDLKILAEKNFAAAQANAMQTYAAGQYSGISGQIDKGTGALSHGGIPLSAGGSGAGKADIAIGGFKNETTQGIQGAAEIFNDDMAGTKSALRWTEDNKYNPFTSLKTDVTGDGGVGIKGGITMPTAAAGGIMAVDAGIGAAKMLATRGRAK